MAEMEEKTKSETIDERFWSDLNQAFINVPYSSHKPCVLLKSVNIDSQEMMDRIVNLFFEKAISNPNCITPYGIVCKNLSGRYSSTVNFLKSIIARCLSELENCSRNENLRATKAKENEKCKDSKKKKELQTLYAEEGRSIRMKSVGTIWLLKEMWLQKILKKKVMHSCIDYLLQHGDEENLEFLYKLLREIGENLEFNGDLEKYYNLIQIRINDQGPEKISFRLREMLQELILLRALPRLAALKKKKTKDSDSHEKALNAEIRCILNSFDPQNIDTVASEIKSLPIEKDNLQDVINILLEKAFNDVDFSRPCVLLCKKLASMEVPRTDVKIETWKNFEFYFLFECVYEFEQYLAAVGDLKKEESTDPEEFAKSVTYAGLIGDLFREGVLPRVIVEDEIQSMLEHKTEENIVRLCILLDTLQDRLVHFDNLITYFDDLQQTLAERASGRFSDDCYDDLECTLDWMDLLLIVARREGIIPDV